MEIFNSKIENEPVPKDVSAEFLSMDSYEFRRFLRTNKNEPSLSITIDWRDVSTARRLKAFLENSPALGQQKRSATIRATKEQYEQERNVFTSGVLWEEV